MEEPRRLREGGRDIIDTLRMNFPALISLPADSQTSLESKQGLQEGVGGRIGFPKSGGNRFHVILG